MLMYLLFRNYASLKVTFKKEVTFLKSTRMTLVFAHLTIKMYSLYNQLWRSMSTVTCYFNEAPI